MWGRQMGNYQFVLLKNVPKRNEDRSYVKFVCYAAENAFICNLVFWERVYRSRVPTTQWVLPPLTEAAAAVGPACFFQAIPLHF